MKLVTIPFGLKVAVKVLLFEKLFESTSLLVYFY